jgi:hypothetical protein
VFILPVNMGLRLSVIRNGQADLVWMHPSELTTGGIAKIKWGAAIAATGTVLAPYLVMKKRLTLAGYDAEIMPFDWRQAPAVTGKMLSDRIHHPGLTVVSLVCRSISGLVARQMAAEDGDICETPCGTSDDSQPVQQYEDSLGVTRAFVDAHQTAVEVQRWHTNLASIYTNPGNVAGQR